LQFRTFKNICYCKFETFKYLLVYSDVRKYTWGGYKMAGFFSKLKHKLNSSDSSRTVKEPEEEGYVELGTDSSSEESSKINVRPYVIEDFEHIKPVLDSLREGHTIALINIKPLKDKDIVELKRAINKLKKTCDAIEGDIAGFGDDWIAAVPSFAHIYRKPAEKNETKDNVSEVNDYAKNESSESASEPQDDGKIETYE